jgi:hypothetical protein
MKISLREWIKQNRDEIDNAINSVLFRYDGRGTVPNPPPSRNDDERRQWVLNDEGLYNWARSEARV